MNALSSQPSALSSDRLAALEVAARSWEHTPFCEGRPVKGSGVSCHHLVAEVLFEAGWLPRVPVPNGPPGWARSQKRSLIVEWIEQSGLFIERQLPCTPVAGDVLGFRIGLCVHHAALALGDGRIVHAVKDHGVRIAEAIPDPWAARLEKIWSVK